MICVAGGEIEAMKTPSKSGGGKGKRHHISFIEDKVTPSNPQWQKSYGYLTL
jgi:hypothetical protein